MAQSKVPEDDNVSYTVFIRVPFPRGDFVDPPIIDWDASKDRELWKTLSSTPKGTDIDWNALADKFDATPAFLLQQAAWLYERQLSQVREQLRRINKPSGGNSVSPTPPSVSGSTTVGAQAMKRGGSGGSRVPSSLSVRHRGSTDFRNDGSAPSTPIQGRAPSSRTTSTNTIMQVQRSSREMQTAFGTSQRTQRRSLDVEKRESLPPTQNPDEEPDSPKADLSSSSSSSDAQPISQSRAFARRPRFSSPKAKGKAAFPQLSSADEEDDEEDTPAFLPFSNVRQDDPARQPAQDPNATLGKQSTAEYRARPNPSASSSASLSSPAQPSSSVPSVSSPPAPPARTSSNPNALAALSPRQRRVAKEGSEGTPSMGSSFSDLDDASLTRSALEEALARDIKAGKGSLGVVSRMGGLWRGQGQSSRGGG